MHLTADDVKKVAVLARLNFTESEVGTFTNQLANIVTFVEQLSEVDTDGIEPLAHPLDVHSVLRSDERRPGLSREAALSNSPSHDDSCFLVPAVLAAKK
jgi:aspartyl-tRNA(Asn)/glutamyl-tRNA(Gln) amidotransferase subunit C